MKFILFAGCNIKKDLVTSVATVEYIGTKNKYGVRVVTTEIVKGSNRIYMSKPMTKSEANVVTRMVLDDLGE